MKLSVIIATHNEEANISSCIDAVKELADEIIVADGESTDQTVAIARSKGATVLQMTNKRMFHLNKEEARKKAKGEWILFLDADEIVTPALAKEISRVLEGMYPPLDLSLHKQFKKHTQFISDRDGVTFSSTEPINGYFIPRKNYFLGRYLMHSGVYPDGVIRLVRKNTAYWPCKDVHETMVVQGGVSWLSEPMIHLADPTFKRYLERANRYTTLTAVGLKKDNVGTDTITTLRYMFWLPLKTFMLLFFRHKGFLDGFSGFVWALMSGLHFPMAYMKYRHQDF